MANAQEYVIPKKKTPLNAADQKDLDYWMNRMASDLEKDPDGKWADYNRRWLEAARAEVARRANGGAKAAAPAASTSNGNGQPSTALAKPVRSSIIGSFGDPVKVTEHLIEAAKNYHLVAPATVCGRLPEGCEVVMSLVYIDPDDPRLYGVGGGKFCPDKAHLIMMLNAIGGSMEYTKRLDDRTHPHRCEAEVGISYRGFDGTLLYRSGSAEMDAREPNGPRYVEIVEQARSATPPRDPSSQLLQLRKFLWPHTVSRALCAAIANTGVRRSYTKEDLKKPFACASLMFTGHSNDPEARREFRAAIANSFLGGRQALYGGASATAGALPSHGGGQAEPMPDYGSVTPYDLDTDGDSSPTNAAPAANTAPAKDAPAAAAPSGEVDRGPNPDNY